jgi:hypothetical protein
MSSHTIAASAIEHDADARSQFEHLLSRLSDEENQRVTHGALEAMVQAEGGICGAGVSWSLADQAGGHPCHAGSASPGKPLPKACSRSIRSPASRSGGSHPRAQAMRATANRYPALAWDAILDL